MICRYCKEFYLRKHTCGLPPQKVKAELRNHRNAIRKLKEEVAQ